MYPNVSHLLLLAMFPTLIEFTDCPSKLGHGKLVKIDVEAMLILSIKMVSPA
jgi:hypothetical protein